MTADLLADLPPFAAEDTNALMERVGAFAEQVISRHGEFFPYGAAIRPDGELVLLGSEPEGSEAPDDVYNLLVTGLRGERDQWRSACLAVNVTHPELKDAVQFNLDFAGGSHGLTAFLPYRPGGLWRKPSFGELVVGPGQSFVWGSADQG
jgi:hypothetical protein